MSQEKVKIDDLGFSEEELFSIQSHSDEEAERITAPRYSYWKSVFRVFFRKKINIFVLIVLVLVVGFAFIYPPLSGYDEFANLMDSSAKHLSPAAAMEKFGTGFHCPGADLCRHQHDRRHHCGRSLGLLQACR